MTFHIDPMIHLGDLLVSAFLAAVGWGLRKLYKAAVAFIERMDHLDAKVERHAQVIDEHTDVIVRAGWSKARDIPRLSRPHVVTPHAED